MATKTDLAYQISLTLGDHIADFDIDGIVEEIGEKYGRDIADIDAIPSEEYWAIVERHDTTKQPEKTDTMADAIIKTLAAQARYAKVTYAGAASAADRNATYENQREAFLASAKADAAESAIGWALMAADGEQQGIDYYMEWAENLLAETPDSIGLTDLASGTPRKGGDWRDYRPCE